MSIKNKECSECYINKGINQFHIKRANKDGLSGHCKTCRAKKAVWERMMFRCYSIKCANYKNYGGRGITVCKEWLTYEGMKDWIETYWVKGLQVDRIDNNKGYSPENCRFTTSSINNFNRRKKSRCSSDYRGITWNGHANKWMAYIQTSGKNKHIGLFTDELNAAKAHDNYIKDNNLVNNQSNQLNF